MSRVFAFAVSIGVVLFASTTPIQAWGPVGHKAVVELARELLDPEVRKVDSLLAGEAMVDVVMWPDKSRDTTHPETYNWHFVNVPIYSKGYRESRDCKPDVRGDCVINAIDRLKLKLADPSITNAARREALIFMLHFVGDIHQPLHAGHNNDLGGNFRTITEIGGSKKLHGAWDSGILDSLNRTQPILVSRARNWLNTQDRAAIAAGTPRDWAAESFLIARDIAYAHVEGDNTIDPDEAREAGRIIDKRVARAAARLAAILNDELRH